MKYILGVISIFLFLIFNFIQSCSRKAVFVKNNNKLDSVFFGYESNYDSTQELIVRSDTSTVFIVILNQFNDSVILFHNNSEKLKKHLVHKAGDGRIGNPESIKIQCKPGKNNISIYLINEKRFITFQINNKYPLCTIQRYNQVWYVNFRKYIMLLQ